MNLLHHNLERAAQADPNHIAFRCGKESISYGQLFQSAKQFARLLRERGLRQGDRVGIYMTPSIQTAIAVYGTLTAGCVYLPIDPQTPSSRFADLLRIGDVRALAVDLVSDNAAAAIDSERKRLRLVIGNNSEAPQVDFTWDELQQFDADIETIDVPETAPAYTIFTSGSTGTPKGIVHSHRSGQAYARLSKKTYDVKPADRIANLSPLHFDMSTFGYLTAVHAGATTILVPPSYGMLPASLSQLIQDEQISIWYSVPFALIQLLQRGVLDQRDCSSIRWVLYGGEPFAAGSINALRRQWPQAAVSNVYGPAEVNQCTYHHVPSWSDSPQPIPEDRAVPIGKIWDETESMVVDQNDTPVETGQGSLLIHSSTMMTRYWNGSDDDGDVFWVSPEGQRFYRTGDIVHIDDQENLVFVGREDRLIKIRGYRVELDEIESKLVEHSLVVETAVAYHAGELVSGVICKSGSELTDVDLRKFLSEQLPPYAIPNSIQICNSFPRTSSGKIDRPAFASLVASKKI